MEISGGIYFVLLSPSLVAYSMESNSWPKIQSSAVEVDDSLSCRGYGQV